ncbi:hypothetical protein BJY52DRAFT_488192 [Lactarius psammicola]|nr:hypothetical protein BJY52DRAFT_488192 [Lactarius psammicola]
MDPLACRMSRRSALTLGRAASELAAINTPEERATGLSPVFQRVIDTRACDRISARGAETRTGNAGGQPSWSTREDGAYAIDHGRTWRKRAVVRRAKRKAKNIDLGFELGAHGGEKDVSEPCTPGSAGENEISVGVFGGNIAFYYIVYCMIVMYDFILLSVVNSIVLS